MAKSTALLVLVVVVSCLVGFVVSAPVYTYSPSQYFGNGAFRTYFAVDGEMPIALGCEWSASFLHERPYPGPMMGTPEAEKEEKEGHMHMETTLAIPLPDEVPVYTPFQSFETNYSPGHTPPYDQVHFDYHFYFQSPEQRASNITAGTCGAAAASKDSWCRGTTAYPPACCPPAYGNIGVIVPAMGGHLVDLLAPEMKGAPWISQFTFGTFNGRITFYEIMIPISAFERIVNGSLPKTCNPIRLPAEFADPGYYPSLYCFWLSNSGNVRIELSNFVHFATSGCNGPVDPTTTCSLLPGAVDTTTKAYKKNCDCDA